MSLIKHYISLDERKFQSKPENADAGVISQNLGSSESNIDVTIKELMEYLVQPNGQSWSPATFSNNSRTAECWESQGFVALDFDYEDPNHPDPKKAEKYKKDIEHKKEFFGPNYKPGISLEDVILRCEKYGVMPCAAHTSFSSDETNNRFRLIFQLHDTNTNPKIQKFLLTALYMLFPESDKACSGDIARLFYGGKDEIYSEYNNILDIEALFKGSLDYITSTFNSNSEHLKEHLNQTTLVNGIEKLSYKDVIKIEDKTDIVEYKTNDGKNNFLKFTFGERVKDDGKQDVASFNYHRKDSETVMDDWDVKWLTDALKFVNAEDREIWVNVGLGLKQSFGDTAKDIWKTWSKTASNADDDAELDKRWKGFKPNGSITVGSVREYAKKGGWDPVPETVKTFNKKYFHYINDSGSEVVCEEVVTEEANRFGKVVKDIYLKEIKRTAFINFLEGVRPVKLKKNGQDHWENRGKYWITHAKRRRVKKIVFKPKGNLLPGEYNLWSNFQSMKEYVPIEHVDTSKFDLYMKHLFDIIANGNKEIAKYILGWMAYCVQYPENIPGVALILIGKQGTGKSLWVELFGQIFGKHYICLQSQESLTGRFNSQLANKVLVFADEAVWKGDYKAIEKLKNNTTNPKLNLEKKGKDQIVYDSYMHIIMASNNRTVLKIDTDDRRFFIVELNDKWYKKKDETLERSAARKQYFDAMVKQFNHEGGMEHFYSFLKGYDLSNFDLSVYPNTDIKDEHKMKALEPKLEGFLISKLMTTILYEDQERWGVVKRSDLYDDYCRYIKLHNPGWAEPLPDNMFGKELRRLLPGCVRVSTGTVRYKLNGDYKYERASVYSFDPILRCRNVLEKTINININWDDIEECECEILPLEKDDDKVIKISSRINKDVYSVLNDALGSNKNEDKIEIKFGSETISF